MRQTIAELGAALAEDIEKLRTSKPVEGVKNGETTTPNASRLEQVAPDAVALLNDEKRKPVTETVLKVVPPGRKNENVMVTLRFTTASSRAR